MHTLPLYYCTMTPYDATFKGLHILYDKDNVLNTLGAVVSKAGKKQLRIAETEKYAHVTFFFSGGREALFENEERILVPSPKVATYDLQPEMSAYQVKDKLVEALGSKKFDFIALNFANGDMVGHTGIYQAIGKAVKAVDECVGEVVAAAQANGYTVLITADHGNAEEVFDDEGHPITSHTKNVVPFCVTKPGLKLRQSGGKLSNIAPTILDLLGLAKPKEMDEDSLIEK